MKTCDIYSSDSQVKIRIEIADNFIDRFKGLMFKKELKEKDGLLLKNCSAIHCCFMYFAIDAVYLDEDLRIVGIETVRPWHVGKIFKGTKHILELVENGAVLLTPGMKLELQERQ